MERFVHGGEQIEDGEAEGQASAKSAAGEEKFVRKGRLVGEAGRVENVERFALLLVLKDASEFRRIALLQKVVVILRGGLIVARQILEFLFDHWTGLNAALQGADL